MARPAFISYARNDAECVAEIMGRLRQLGFDPWADRALRGGQVWWDEILAQIRDCDVFIAVVSTASLDSQACARERSYAEDLVKPVVPVVVDDLHSPLPLDLASRQLVEFNPNSPDAAFKLASAVIGLPANAPLPDPLPPEPEMPLSYLSRLIERAQSRRDMSRPQQHDMLTDLEPGLRATDPEERQGAWRVLEMLEVRSDLFADAARRIERLRAEYSDDELRVQTGRAVRPSTGGPSGVPASQARPTRPRSEDLAGPGASPRGG